MECFLVAPCHVLEGVTIGAQTTKKARLIAPGFVFLANQRVD
jgi:hypothetical protein